MTTEKEGKSLCQWFHQLKDCNVCLTDGYNIEEDTKTKYCEGNWRECELYQKERRREPLLKERLGD